MHLRLVIPLLLLNLSFCMQLHAQEVEWSNSRKLKGASLFTKVLGQNEEGIYLMRHRNRLLNRSIIIERYRHEMGFVYAKSINLKKGRLVNIRMRERGFRIMVAVYNRELLRNELFTQLFDWDVNPITEKVLLCTSTLSDFYDKGDFRVRYQHEGEKILVSYTEKSKDNKRILRSVVFDREFRSLFEKAVELPYKYYDVAIKRINFDNGNDAFYLVSRIVKQNKKISTGSKAYSLYHLNTAQGALVDYELNDSNLFVHNVEFAYDRSTKKIQLVGFYSREYHKDFEGIYSLSVSTSVDAESRSHNVPFHIELKEILLPEEVVEEDEGIKDLNILKIIPNASGGISIVTERSSVSAEEDIMYVNGVPQAMSRNIYNYDDIIVLTYDSLFQLQWDYVINKNQSSLNDGGYFSSAIVTNTRSHIYIIFNDQLRNSGDVMQYTLNNKGDAKYKILFRSDEEYVSVIPIEAKQIAYNELLLPTNRDKKFALLKLVYPN